MKINNWVFIEGIYVRLQLPEVKEKITVDSFFRILFKKLIIAIISTN